MQNSGVVLTGIRKGVNLKRGEVFAAGRNHTAEILSLYEQRKGHKTIAKILSIPPRIVRVILIEQGVYQPGKLRPLRGGPQSKEALRQRRLQAHINRMHRRAKRCLATKAEKHPSPTKGMTQAEVFRWRYQNDIAFRIRALCRRRMRKAIIDRGAQKTAGTIELLGCTGDEARRWIESKFKRGMTWANHGRGPGYWEIDHIIACAKFDLRDPKQQRQCFHFTNLQPMWSEKNAEKGDELQKHEQLALV